LRSRRNRPSAVDDDALVGGARLLPIRRAARRGGAWLPMSGQLVIAATIDFSRPGRSEAFKETEDCRASGLRGPRRRGDRAVGLKSPLSAQPRAKQGPAGVAWSVGTGYILGIARRAPGQCRQPVWRVSEWLAATLEMSCRETGCEFDSRALRSATSRQRKPLAAFLLRRAGRWGGVRFTAP
jgi:hypothetical protein